MSLNDTLHYVFISNPISSTAISGLSSVAKMTGIRSSAVPAVNKSVNTEVANLLNSSLYKLTGNNVVFIRLAGLSGTTAILLYDAYARYGKTSKMYDETNLIDFHAVNNFHLIHSIILLGMPLVHRPWVSGSLFITGTILYCGPNYYTAFTGKRIFNSTFVAASKICLLLGWCSLLIL